MQIEKGRTVAIAYKLYSGEGEDREILNEESESDPLVFQYGKGEIVDALERTLFGLKQGDSFTCKVVAREAYQWDKDNVQTFPIDMFKNEKGEINTDEVKINNMVYFDDEEGNEVGGIVKLINSKEVTIDFNYPFPDDMLYFVGKVINVI